MIDLIAQATPVAPWQDLPQSGQMWLKIFAGLLVSIGLMFAMFKMPTRGRKPIVWFATFVCGLFYVLLWIWPEPVNRQPDDLPRNGTESIAFLLADTQPVIANVTNILVAFLLGLGVFSLIRIHVTKIYKKQADRGFSIVLLIAFALITVVGYWDWNMVLRDKEGKLVEMANWTPVQQWSNILFEGLLQQMDSAMFSMIAFFILSAAYRAFRIRSIEATMLMASALILMISLMSIVVAIWNGGVTGMAVGMGIPYASAVSGEAGVFNNLKLEVIAGWVTSQLQTPALRAVDFGIGLGALAMGLRLWLGLEKGGVTV